MEIINAYLPSAKISCLFNYCPNAQAPKMNHYQLKRSQKYDTQFTNLSSKHHGFISLPNKSRPISHHQTNYEYNSKFLIPLCSFSLPCIPSGRMFRNHDKRLGRKQTANTILVTPNIAISAVSNQGKRFYTISIH